MTDAEIYVGAHIVIRRITPDDAALLHGWLQEPAFAAYKPNLLTVCPSPTLLAERIAMQQLIDPPVEVDVLVLHRPTAMPIGAMTLSGIDPVNGKAELSFGFVRGRGTRCVTEAVAFALETAFEGLRLHKLVFYLAEDNHEMLTMARRYGIAEEGRLRDELRRGEGWQDIYRFALLSDDWRASRLRGRLRRVAPVSA